MVEVTKSIHIRGHYDIEYIVYSQGNNAISVFAHEPGDQYDYDNPLLFLSNDEAKAMAKALSELANGY